MERNLGNTDLNYPKESDEATIRREERDVQYRYGGNNMTNARPCGVCATLVTIKAPKMTQGHIHLKHNFVVLPAVFLRFITFLLLNVLRPYPSDIFRDL